MIAAKRMMTELERLEFRLDILTQELYKRGRCFTPLYPWVFVRVLKKDQATQSGVILPAIEQNKTIHEGIVLATWKPKEGKSTRLMPGDHVLFPHWAGLPIAGYSIERYRVIREEAWKENEQGGIFARVEYENTTIERKLVELLEEGLPNGRFDRLAERIMQQFLLVDRDGESVTLSGR
jgi:co-chaperonin GroES (HSP10)